MPPIKFYTTALDRLAFLEREAELVETAVKSDPLFAEICDHATAAKQLLFITSAQLTADAFVTHKTLFERKKNRSEPAQLDILQRLDNMFEEIKQLHKTVSRKYKWRGENKRLIVDRIAETANQISGLMVTVAVLQAGYVGQAEQVEQDARSSYL